MCNVNNEDQVFCVACKYYEKASTSALDVCNHPSFYKLNHRGEKRHLTEIRGEGYSKSYCDRQNNLLDCKLYERYK